MNQTARDTLLRYVQLHLPDIGVTQIELFSDRKLHVVADWDREYGNTHIRLIKTAQGRVELSKTTDPRGVAQDAIVTSFIPYDNQGRKHGWHTTWYSYMHRVHSKRLYEHGVLLQEHRYDDRCDGNQTKLAIWNADMRSLKVRGTLTHQLVRRSDGTYQRENDPVDTVYDRHIAHEYVPNGTHQHAIALVTDDQLERVITEWLLAETVAAESELSDGVVAPTLTIPPAAIVVMHMKRSTLPVACLGRVLNAIRDLEARKIIASQPQPVLADCNAYPLQPEQAVEIVLAVHRIGPNRQPGELLTRVNIA